MGGNVGHEGQPTWRSDRLQAGSHMFSVDSSGAGLSVTCPYHGTRSEEPRHDGIACLGATRERNGSKAYAVSAKRSGPLASGDRTAGVEPVSGLWVLCTAIPRKPPVSARYSSFAGPSGIAIKRVSASAPATGQGATGNRHWGEQRQEGARDLPHPPWRA